MSVIFASIMAALGVALIRVAVHRLLREQSWPELVRSLPLLCLVLGGVLRETEQLPAAIAQPGVAAVVGSTCCLALAVGKPRTLNGGRQVWMLGPAAVALIAALTDVINVGHGTPQAVVLRLVPAVILALVASCAMVVPPRKSDVAAIAVAAFGLLLALTLVDLSGAYRECDQFKCGFLGRLFTGAVASENYLGRFGVFVALVVVACAGWRAALVLWLPLLLTLIGGNSRSPIVAVAVAIAAGLAVAMFRVSLTVSGREKLWVAASIVVPLTLSGAGVALFALSEHGQFSNRGTVWRAGVDLLGSDWWRGLGMAYWGAAQDSGWLPQLFPHNEYLLLVFGGGAVSLLSFIAFACMFYYKASELPDWSRYWTILSFVLIIGWTEVVWNPVSIDGQTAFITMTTVAAAAGLQESRTRNQDRRRGKPAAGDPYISSSGLEYQR